MDVLAIQSALNKRGHMPPLEVDGIAGKLTMQAVDAALVGLPINNWSDERRRIAFEQFVYRDALIEVGGVDGLIGPQTLYARDVYEGRQKGPASIEETWRDPIFAKPPNVPNPVKSTVWPLQKDALAFFGVPGANHVRFQIPFPMKLSWDLNTRITSFAVNKKILASVDRVYMKVLTHYGMAEIERLRLDRYGGCYANRKMRGGSNLSMHAFAAAIDTDPERNQLKWGRKLAALDDPAYNPWWSFWEDEGAVSLGRAHDRDWMHVQFARV